MLTAAGSPLVAGSVVSVNTMAKRVKVIRSFMWAGKPQKVGDIVEVPDGIAFEVTHSHKAEYVPDAAPQVAVAPEETVAPVRRRSSKDAG